MKDIEKGKKEQDTEQHLGETQRVDRTSLTAVFTNQKRDDWFKLCLIYIKQTLLAL